MSAANEFAEPSTTTLPVLQPWVKMEDLSVWKLKENPLHQSETDKRKWYTSYSNPSDVVLDVLLSDGYIQTVAKDGTIDWKALSSNCNDRAINVLEANPDQIWWNGLFSNTNRRATLLVKQRYLTSTNTQAINDNNNNPNKPRQQTIEELDEDWYDQRDPDWRLLSQNPGDANVQFLIDYPHLIWWPALCMNPNLVAIDMVTKQVHEQMTKVDGMMELDLSQLGWVNPRHYYDNRVYWSCIRRNPNNQIINLLVQYGKQGSEHESKELSRNRNGHLVNWDMISINPIIYQGYDYFIYQLTNRLVTDYKPFLHNRMVASGLAEELMQRSRCFTQKIDSILDT